MDTTKFTEQAGQKAQEARETAQQMKETAQEWTDKAKGKARDAGAAADLYVHEYTWTTLMLVATGACVLGYLLGRQER